jgi:hypothetical protein
MASFVGILAAMPVAFLVVSMAQPANAMQAQQNQPTGANYKQYLEGYTQGYLASVKQDNSSSIDVANCAQSGGNTNEASPAAQTASTAGGSYQPMSQNAWSQEVNNSYNTYSSSTKTTNNITTTVNKKQVTNINSNNTVNSNNTAVSEVTVKDSVGTVVASGATTNGDANASANVANVNSNNTTTTNTEVKINDSFNTDSHDKTTNTTNTEITNIDDSFNHVNTTLNNHTVVNDKKHHAPHCA